jgi:serine/threonine protein kinase
VIVKRKRKNEENIRSEPLKSQDNNQNNANYNRLSRTQKLLESCQISYNELVVEREVGEGSYGKVCLGKWNDATVALKFCRNKGNIDEFVSEIKIMIQLPPHPNIVQLFGVSLNRSETVIVMEYCAGDRLLYDNYGGQELARERKIELVRGIARGVLHLHKHNIIHCDLSSRNILLSSSGEPKISDFGMSRLLEESTEGKTKRIIGPFRWMAPESIAAQIYSKKTDVWTFGILVYEIVAQCEPHKNKNVLEIAVAIRDHGLTPTIPDDCPPLLREIMIMCWKKNPNERPTFETILAKLTNVQNVGIG